MRILNLIIGLILLGQLSCSTDEISTGNSFKDDASITSLNGTWKVVSFEDYSANTVEYKTEENSWGEDIIVTFDDTLDPAQFSGKATTNLIHGKFEYTGHRQFETNHYASTFVAQPEWADKFANALLDDHTTFKINTDTLRIYYDNNSKSVTLTKE